MRRLLALCLLICATACGCVGGFAAPAALAAGSGSSGAAGTSSSGAAGSSSSGTAGSSSPGLSLSNAQQNAVSSIPQTQTVIPVSTTSSSSGGLSGLDAVIIAIVAVLVLGGIAFWVWYDARGHAARVGHGAHEDPMFGGRSHAGSKSPRRPRKLKPAERKRRKRGRAR